MADQRTQMLAMAAACRTLADRCEDGDAPTIGTDYLFLDSVPCCATGWAWHIAGFTQKDVDDLQWKPPSEAARIEMKAATDALYAANNYASDEERPRAVIEPLRVVAAALEKWAMPATPTGDRAAAKGLRPEGGSDA